VKDGRSKRIRSHKDTHQIRKDKRNTDRRNVNTQYKQSHRHTEWPILQYGRKDITRNRSPLLSVREFLKRARKSLAINISASIPKGFHRDAKTHAHEGEGTPAPTQRQKKQRTFELVGILRPALPSQAANQLFLDIKTAGLATKEPPCKLRGDTVFQ